MHHIKYLIYLLIIGLTGCMVGPNFHSPAPPRASEYIQGKKLPKKTQATTSIKNGGQAQAFHYAKSIPGDWWRVFHSKQLDSLIHDGLKHSPNLAAAKAVLTQAQENYLAQVGTLFPSIAGNFFAQRQRFSPNQFGGSSTGRVGSQIFNLINANISMSYTLDLFGGLRRQIEAAGAQVDFQEFELEAAFLTLSSNIVTTSITIASLRAQIDASILLISAQERTLALVKKQFNLGSTSRADILSQENQLAQTRAALPPLKQSLAENLHTLSILVGKLPNENELPNFNLDSLRLPTDLPLSCPSLLTRQRPDIRAAEALLHTASARIGVATANLFPQINITGFFGQQSPGLSTLFQSQNNVWSIAGAVAQPIFQGGTLLAQRRAAFAAYEQAAAQYRQTLLQAFQNVADTLRALEHDAQLLKAQRAAEVAAHDGLALTKKQFQLGSVSYLNLLNAERTYQQAQISRIQAQAARFTDTATLFQALGGGWWNRCSLSCNPSLAQNLNQYRPERFNKRNCCIPKGV